MALGMTEFSGALTGPDIGNPAELDWSTMTGIPSGHPIVTGQRGGSAAFDPDAGLGRIATLPPAERPASGVGTINAHLLDDWRDLFNFKGSPMPWLLLFSLAALGFVQFSIAGRAGPIKAGAQAG